MLGVSEETIKSGSEPPGVLGNLAQLAELTGNGRRVGSFLTEIHGGKSRGDQGEIQGPGPSVLSYQSDRTPIIAAAYAGKRIRVTFAAVRAWLADFDHPESRQAVAEDRPRLAESLDSRIHPKRRPRR